MIIRQYKDLYYTTIFNPKTGFFARIEEPGKKEPFWSPHGPELMDISITNWCDKCCDFCYRKSNLNGKHMLFDDYKKLIKKASEIGVFQVALGGGNPNQHPNFSEILYYTRKLGIIPNYTTNGRGLTKNIIESTKNCCGAVAVSAYEPYYETTKAIDVLLDNGIKTNVNFILTSESINTALDWLDDPPNFLLKINAIIFLNFKSTNSKYNKKLLKNSSNLKDFFIKATSSDLPFKVGFDSCSVNGIFSFSTANPITIEACDAARFSMFISENMKCYPCSFQEQMHDGDIITEKNDILNIWLTSINFINYRNYFYSNICINCEYQKYCMNGCAIFDDLKICKHFL